MLDLFGVGEAAQQLARIAQEINMASNTLHEVAITLSKAIKTLNFVATSLLVLTTISAIAIISDILVIIHIKKFLQREKKNG